MIRRLAILLLVLLVLYLIRRMGRRRRPAAEVPSAAVAPRFEGAMVRDRECQTFLPRSRALSVRCDDGEHFFCSPRCRSQFLDRVRATRSA